MTNVDYDPQVPEVGRKRARTISSPKPAGLSNEEYLEELVAEYERHKKLEGADKMPHSERLVLAQIELIQTSSQEKTENDAPEWNTDHGEGIRTELASKEATGTGSNVKAILKIFIPEDVPGDTRGTTSRGRLLGPKGATIQRLQEESGCKMQIRGRGSVKFKDGSTEESHLHEETYAHLREDLHVSVQHDGAAHLMHSNFKTALSLVRTVVTGGVLQPAQPPSFEGPGGHSHSHWSSGGPYSMQGGGGTGSASSWQESTAAEVAAAQAASRQGQIMSVVASNKEMGSHCSTVLRLFVPQRTSVGDSRGKLLGQKGATLRQLQHETGMRMSIRGKGSMRIPEGENEAALMATDKYAHLKDELHVVMEYEGPIAERDTTLNSAQVLIRSMLTPIENAHPGQKHPMSQYEALKTHQPHHHPPHHQPYHQPPHYGQSPFHSPHPANPPHQSQAPYMPPNHAPAHQPPPSPYGHPGPHGTPQPSMPDYSHSQPYNYHQSPAHAAPYPSQSPGPGPQYPPPHSYDQPNHAHYRGTNQYYYH